jgi:hypothetical protein
MVDAIILIASGCPPLPVSPLFHAACCLLLSCADTTEHFLCGIKFLSVTLVCCVEKNEVRVTLTLIVLRADIMITKISDAHNTSHINSKTVIIKKLSMSVRKQQLQAEHEMTTTHPHCTSTT